MFSTGHFIWLGIIALFIVLFLFLSKKFKPSHDLIRRIVFFLLVPLKIFHMSLSLKESSHGGFIIDQPQLSFHLCSIMIYAVILINLIPNEKFVKTMKSFMVPCMLLGAAMALLIPTEGVDPATPRVWQYMLIHGVLVFYGLYLAIVEKVDLSIKALGQLYTQALHVPRISPGA
ncbi:MAG: YwaF family protein [Clostridia bacterium]|nr:YwaF family protein [Clostridia bacterium]